MELDAFTVVAQILNFAVLVYLLKRFLYRPVLDAMKRREDTIVQRLEDAREQREEAELLGEDYRAKLRDIDEERRAVLDAAREEADRRSVEMHEQLRARIQARESEWEESFRRKTQEQFAEVRDELREAVAKTVRAALRDLADEDLERRAVAAFVRRLETLPEAELELLRGQSDPNFPVTVVTAHALDPAQRAQIEALLDERLEVPVAFERDGSLILGIELRCHGHRLGWNLPAYLEGLEDVVDVDLAAARLEREGKNGRKPLP